MRGSLDKIIVPSLAAISSCDLGTMARASRRCVLQLLQTIMMLSRCVLSKPNKTTDHFLTTSLSVYRHFGTLSVADAAV